MDIFTKVWYYLEEDGINPIYVFTLLSILMSISNLRDKIKGKEITRFQKDMAFIGHIITIGFILGSIMIMITK